MHATNALSMLAGGVCALALAAVSPARADTAPGGDAAPQNFEGYCRGDLSVRARETFPELLARAEKAVAAKNGLAASQALGEAERLAYRGGAETDMSVKCFGQPTYRRWFDTKIAAWRLGVSAGTGGSGFILQDIDRYALLALDDGADALVAEITTKSPALFRPLYRTTERLADQLDGQREFGAFMLPEEIRIEQNARGALATLRDYAAGQVESALKAEAEAFRRPASDIEQQGMRGLESVQQLNSAMAGVDMVDPDADEEILISTRYRDSREQLRHARHYAIGEPVESGKDASGVRAEQRGEQLMALASDEARSLPFRDSVYDMAIGYFDWCECAQARAAAQSARDAIQPALAAEEAEREAKLEAATSRMRQDAEQALKDMQKSDAEKQSFKEEADAMEAELGF